MKEINNTKSQVYLSTYDNSDTLLPVSEEHKNMENACVAVKFGDTLIKISSEDTCKCTWNEAMEKHQEELMHPAFWQMVGTVFYEVNQALEMIRHCPLQLIWTGVETETGGTPYVWVYNGPIGDLYYTDKYYDNSVRATKVFKIKE